MKLIFSIIALSITCSFGKSVPANSRQTTTDMPNIILIVADDLGYTDIGCYGGEIQTPNLDQLAAEGLRLTQFYNGGVCNVTRACIITGLYNRKGSPKIDTNMVTIGEVLGSNGYNTILSGKWHLGWGDLTNPVKRGFQEFYGFMVGAVNYFDPTLPDLAFLDHWGPEKPFVRNNKIISEVEEDYYVTDALTDHAIENIKKSVEEEKPFFLHLAYNAPHYPLHALPEDIAKYRGKYDEGYGVLREERYRNAIHAGVIEENWELPPPDEKSSSFIYDLEADEWDSLTEKEKARESEKMEVYAAMVHRMDYNIGRVMDAVERLNIDKNTLIIFFSDNGGCASILTKERDAGQYKRYQLYNEGKQIGTKDSYEFCGPGWATAQSSPFRRYKVWTYEGGISTPMIVRWKGKIKPGSLSNEIGHVVDLLPTFCDITGIEYPEQFNGNTIIPAEGISLKPVLFGEKSEENREIGWYLYGNRAYRKGKWKIVWGTSDKEWELYDMENDRTELEDLSTEYPNMVKDLSSKFYEWAMNCGFDLKDSNN